jgi:thiosulfate/3-mercaptopyruvate sulfurtransferase
VTGFGSLGLRTLYYTLGLGQEILVPGLAGAGVATLWLCEMFERGPLLAKPGVGRVFLIGLSLVLVGAALGAVRLPQANVAVLAQSAPAKPSQAQEPSQAGPMAPAEVAARLMAGDQNLTVVDLRSPGEFAAFHLKGAINAQAGDLPKTLAWRKNKGSIVLYSEDEMIPDRAAMILAGQGFANVSPLAGGLEGFFRDCLKPASLRDGPVSAQEAEAVKAWRKFFLPAELVSPPAPAWLLDLPQGLTPPGLVEPAWLKANLGKPGLKVIDLRPQPQYNSGHIPGAFSLQPENLRTNMAGLPSMLMPGPMLAGVFGHMGLGPRDLAVLTYGDSLADATLAGLALERLGHGRYLILNGGFKAWEAQGLAKDTLLPQAQTVNYPAPAGPDTFTVDGPQVLMASADRHTVIIDSRPSEYYLGTKSEEARPGHIPGAVNRPFTEDLAKGPGDSVALKPVSELAAAYAGLIKSKDAPVIVHCRTGHLASQTWWVLTRLLGYTNVKYYDAGWSEWAARPQWPVGLKEDKP